MRKVTLLKFLFAGITVCVTLYGTLLLRDYVIGLAGALAIIFLFIYSVVEKRSMRLFLDFIKTSWSASTTKEAKKAAIELIGRDNAEFIEEISPQFVDTVRGLFSKYMSSLKTIGDWIDATLEEASRIRHSTEEFKRKGQESLEASRKILENLDEIKNKIREYLEVGHSLYEKIMERQGESEEILSNLELIASDFEKLATDLVSVFDELFNYWGMLGTSINEISSVTDEISRISKRTSILALNASMEATRAGDVGKGFAVAAENIQKLAADTKKNVERISQNVQELLERANALQDVMVSGSKEISKFKESSNKIINYISTSVKDLTSVFSETISELSRIESMNEILGVIQSNISEIYGIINDINEILDKSVHFITQLENMLVERSAELRQTVEKINRNLLKVEETVNKYKERVISSSDIDQELRRLYEELKELVTLVYMAIDGIGVKLYPHVEIGEAFDYSSRPWYSKTKEKMAAIWIEPYLDYNIGDFVVTYSTPLIRNGKFIGVLCADVKLKSLL